MIGAAKVAGGQGVAFLGNLYAFGAMLSFTIAHASVIALRLRKSKRDPEQPFRAPLNMRVGESTSRCSRCSAASGRSPAFLVVATLFPAVRWAGLGWLVLGMIVYVAYRKRQGLPLTKTVFADTKVRGPAIEIEYRTIVLHITDARVADEMTATALAPRLASGARASSRCTRSRCPRRARCRRSRPRTRSGPTGSWPRPRRSGSSTACR